MVEENNAHESDPNHRISMLESHRLVLEERTRRTDKRVELLERGALISNERLDSMNSVNIETMNTLAKMQTTLEQLSVVLSAFNKWENTKNGIKEIGDIIIWFAKVGIVVGAMWSAFNFSSIYQVVVPNSQKAAPTHVEPQKTTLEKLHELE